jgi:hypothetical protein
MPLDQRRLQQDANSCGRGTPAPNQLDREMQVDVWPTRELDRIVGAVPGPLELLGPPALDPLAFGFDVEVKLCRRHLGPFVAACTQCSVKRPDRISPVWGIPA